LSKRNNPPKLGADEGSYSTAEFLLLFVYIVLVYAIIRGFGPEAQACFSVGARVMQAFFLPVVALSFAVSPVAGQNFGGRRADRVRHSVYSALGIASLMMLALTLIVYLAPATLIRIFSHEPTSDSLRQRIVRIVSLNFRVRRNCFHHFQRVSGNRQYAAAAV